MNESKFHLILFTNVQHFQSSSKFSAAHFDHRRNPEKFGTDEEDKNNLHADGDCSSHEDGKDHDTNEVVISRCLSASLFVVVK